MTAQIVKVCLALYAALAAVSIVLVWRNASAPDAVKNAGIVIASILPILLSVLPYLDSETIEHRFTYMLLFDSQQKRVFGGEVPNPYFLAYLPVFSNLSGKKELEQVLEGKEFSDFMGSRGLDLVERAVLEGLLRKFSGNWDMTPSKQFRGPNQISTQYSPGPSRDRTEVSRGLLMQAFKHNKLLATPEVLVWPRLVLPPGSRLEARPIDPNAREIKIINPNLTVTIAITPRDGMVQQEGMGSATRRSQRPKPLCCSVLRSRHFGSDRPSKKPLARNECVQKMVRKHHRRAKCL